MIKLAESKSIPPEADRAFDAGVLSYGVEDFVAAALHFRRAVELFPPWIAGWINLGECELKVGNYTRAFETFKVAARISPSCADPKLGLGLSLYYKGSYGRAVRYLSDAVELEPGNWKCWAALADALAESARLSQALVAAEKAVALAPDLGDSHFVCGKVSLKAGLVSQALSHFTRSVSLDPTCSPSHHNLGVSYFRQGNFDAALDCQLAAIRCLRVPKPIPTTRKSPPFDSTRGRDALIALGRVLSPHNTRFFLAFGTLLGAIREHGFMSHDKDLDIGLLPMQDPETLRQALTSDSQFSLQEDFRPNQQQFTIYFNGLAIDFFRHRLCGDRLICGFNAFDGGVEWSFTPFDLTPHVLLGAPCFVPSHPEIYLEELYGPEWRKPMPSFEPIISSPARLRSTNDSGGYYLVSSKAYMLLQRGEVSSARELLSQLASQIPSLSLPILDSPHFDALAQSSSAI